MSEIPFVKLLGDQLDVAARRTASEQARSHRRRRRFGVLALTGALVISGSGVATGLFSGSVEKQATTALACYSTADAKFDSVIYDAEPAISELGQLSSVELCRRELALAHHARELRGAHHALAELVACSRGDTVAVIPGRDAGDCTTAGFRPLSPSYARARARTARLGRGLVRLERGADCVAPADLARRTQALLDKSGWTGWTVKVGSDRQAVGHGRCGAFSLYGGGLEATLYGVFDPERHHVLVRRAPPRHIVRAWHARLPGLFKLSGARCLTLPALRARVANAFRPDHVAVTLARHRGTYPGERGVTLDDADGRATRVAEGCAVVASAEPRPWTDETTSHADSIVIQYYLKR